MISVQIYIKKNTLVVKGSATANNSSPFTTIVNSAGGYAVNEFKGHYIKITKGTGLGSISWIVSNTSTNLVLQTGIQIEQYSQYEIYKSEYKRLEQFKDEKISITSSISNANDIGKIYTDYSQSFTIPASDTNNQILSHWYESAIDNGYDHRVRYDAYIEVDTHRFKNGNFQLEKVNKKNGFIESYTMTFYGNLTQLKDKFKDIKLRDLSTGIYAPAFGTDNFWNLFNHTYNSTEVINRIQAFSPYAIYYPLIGSSKQYAYKNGIADQDISLTTAPVVWNELFPAISMPIVFTLIQYCFGVTFTGSFFDLDQWKYLYLYLKNAETVKNQTPRLGINFLTKTTGFDELNLTTDALINDWNWVGGLNRPLIYIHLYITPDAGFATIPYTVYVYRNGQEYRKFTDIIGTQIVECEGLRRQDDGQTYTYTFQISSQSLLTFKPTIRLKREWRGSDGFWRETNLFGYNTTGQSTLSQIQIQNYVPDITVNDFITGIIKAFNLMIIPTDENTFEFLPLESYYNEGKILDITKYVYSDEMDIERPKLYKSINFQYEKSPNVLNNKYKGLYGTEYGDLIYTNNNSNESSNYDIKLPFENVLFEKTVGENFETATIVDKDLKPYIPKPMLIYKNGPWGIDLANPIRITTETGQTTMGSYNRFSNEYNSLPTDTTLSHLMTMNFNNEQSPWYNVIAPQGLYYRHYSNYINNLYNIKTRVLRIKALLPPSLLNSIITDSYGKRLGIALNDRLIIRNKRYIINNYTTDLTSGEASFELITDYRGIDAKSTVGYRFASLERVQVDATAQTFDVIAYKNDYDSFGVKAATNYLSYYTSGLQEKTDLLISVSVPVNTSGLDRTDVIGLEYYSNGILQVTEYVTVLQTAI